MSTLQENEYKPSIPTIKSDDSLCYISSDSDDNNELFDFSPKTYQLIGIVERLLYEKNNTYWWVVNVNDYDEIKKLNIPSMTSFSGLFQYSYSDNLLHYSDQNKVLIEMTFDNNKRCLYEKNKIIDLIHI
jgi:hypothetical protein